MPRITALEDLEFGAFMRPGDRLAWGQISGEPRALVAALGDQCPHLGGIGAFAGMSLGETLPPESAEFIDFKVLGGAATNHRLAAPGALQVIPCRLADVPDLIASGMIGVDVALIQVAPERDGVFNLGISADYMGAAIEAARVVVAEVNPLLPRTRGDTDVPAGAIDIAVPVPSPLPVPPARPPGDVARAVAGHVAALVPDGATIQIGIGGIPDAVLAGLAAKRNLGIHSGLITDGVLDLIEAGAVTNAKKEIDTGLGVTAVIYGAERLYRWAGANERLAVRSVRHTHAEGVMANFRRFVAINSAIEVDLTGQVNAETIGGRHVGQIGGQIDFVRAGALAPEGHSVIALSSTGAKGTVSRIVAKLADGVVTTARGDMDKAVTEYGVAELRGRSLGERARALIAIAHPDFRDALTRAAEHLV
jgi:acetyl-CoA hydrolase